MISQYYFNSVIVHKLHIKEYAAIWMAHLNFCVINIHCFECKIEFVSLLSILFLNCVLIGSGKRALQTVPGIPGGTRPGAGKIGRMIAEEVMEIQR